MSLSFIGRTETLVQRNDYTGSKDYFFNRTWDEYRNEFGNQSSLFWIGLEKLYHMTETNKCTIQFYLRDHTTLFFEEYLSVHTKSSADDYLLNINGCRGNATDAMYMHDGQRFSTSCGLDGGFWYNVCGFRAGINNSPANRFYWDTPGMYIRLRSTEVWLSCPLMRVWIPCGFVWDTFYIVAVKLCEIDNINRSLNLQMRIIHCLSSINQDISNAPANKISRWRARQTMDEIKKKMKRQ